MARHKPLPRFGIEEDIIREDGSSNKTSLD